MKLNKSNNEAVRVGRVVRTPPHKYIDRRAYNFFSISKFFQMRFSYIKFSNEHKLVDNIYRFIDFRNG